MYRKVLTSLFMLLVFSASLIVNASAGPDHISYQGQLSLNGQPYTGSAQFKFVILAAGGTATLWSNDGTSTGGSEPTASLTLTVDMGIFNVRLGDTSTGQSPLSAQLLNDSADAVLRVWVDTGSGFEQMSDQPLSAAPFALQAEIANRSLDDFLVPRNLTVSGSGGVTTSTLLTGGFQMIPAPPAGYVLTSDASGVGSWQAPGGGSADGDWVINGNDMVAGVTGNVGIGTSSPTEKLEVDGTALFQIAVDRSIAVSTPGGWPGFINFTPNGHRRDIIFDDSGIRLLTSDSASAPAEINGIRISETGRLGIKTSIPNAELDVNGAAQAKSYFVRTSGYNDVWLSGDSTVGGELELHRPSGFLDYGITMKAAAHNGAAVMDLFNAANAATIELIAHNTSSGGGTLALGNGTQATAYLDGDQGGGGQLRLFNNAGTKSFQILGQAYSSGSQTNMYDSAGLMAQQWTAANREWKVTANTGTVEILARGTNAGGDLSLYQADGQSGVTLDGDNGGSGEVRVHDQNGSATVQLIGQDATGNGRVITDILEITGGADLSENFDVQSDGQVEPGMVVCIDPRNPGKLVQSQRAYQRTVAGVVSGAGGVRPGLLMGQRGSVASGKHPVALTGRVWTWCDASQGSIHPGDLLTTSATRGHAMKADDSARAHGAILGKAMSTLESDRGLVLVLVSLQ